MPTLSFLAPDSLSDPQGDEPLAFVEADILEHDILDLPRITMVHAKRPLTSLIPNDIAIGKENVFNISSQLAS